MHRWRSSILLCSFAACFAYAATVYKWTDADGVVHYSDQPMPGAERVQTAPSPSRAGPAASTIAPKPATKPVKQPHLGYSVVSIYAPAPEQAFFSEPVTARLNLEPELNPNHTLTWTLNGATVPAAVPNATEITFEQLERGTYTVQATITDQESGESTSSDPVVFYVHMPSVFSPQSPQKPKSQ